MRVKVRRGVGIILLNQRARALGKLGEILLGPPVIQRAVAVVERTLIVKPVADLVTDHHADAAVVRCVVGLRIEEGRAQNSCREHNLVSGRHIVGVHSLRRHQPLVLINRIASAIDHEIAVKGGGAAQVLEQITGHQSQFRVIAPLIRVADLRDKLRKLFQRLLAGGLGHPIQVRDGAAVCFQQVIDQLEHFLLMLRREMHRHVFLAEFLIERVLHSRNAAFPAFAQLFGAREGATVEIEVFLYKRIRQVGCAGTNSAPQSPEFPGHQRGGLPHVRHALQERRLRNNDRAQLFGVCPQRKKPLLERETGELLVKFGGFDGVVFRLCITVFHDIPVMRGDLGLVRENELCRLHRG